MQLRCLNCQGILNESDETLDSIALCPTCGSKVPVVEVQLKARQQTPEHVRHFKLIAEIGRGQFGAVWRARDTILHRDVAIKIPLREMTSTRARQRFLQEAMAAGSLSHPGIVHVYEAFEQEGQIYIVSEFIDGDTLQLHLGDKENRLSYDEAARFLAETALAIEVAHQHKIIHRDLKPGNILVDQDGRPHVTDFGLATQENGLSLQTLSGYPIGTLAYMPPEQAAGESDLIDPRSDVYSLGMILYEILTERRPFQPSESDSDLSRLLDRIRTEQPPPPRSVEAKVPRDLEIICLKAISKDKVGRYATAREFAEDLLRFVDRQPILARPMTLLERADLWFKKNRTLATAAAVVFSAGLFSLLQHRDLPPAAVSYPFVRPVVKPLAMEFTTDPPGAQIAVIPVDSVTGEPNESDVIHPEGTTPLIHDLMPGTYMVVAKLDDGRFHEVYRQVPNTRDDTPWPLYPHHSWDNAVPGKLTLPIIRIPKQDVDEEMAEFSGADNYTIVASIPQFKQRTIRIAPFWMDTHEVTVGKVLKVFKGNFPGNILPEHPDKLDFPMTGIFRDYAMTCLERMGKRLPTEFEYEFAASNGGTSKYPWGKEPRPIPRDLAPVESLAFDRTSNGVYGLLTNGAEYTSSKFDRDRSRAGTNPTFPPVIPGKRAFAAEVNLRREMYTIRGGARNRWDHGLLEEAGAAFRQAVDQRSSVDRVSFRGVRSNAPHGFRMK